jgi:ankyrin repeat protein
MKKILLTALVLLSLISCLVLGGLSTRSWAKGELLDAARTGDLARVNSLIAAGADVNAKDGDGFTALMLASVKGNAEVVNLLKQADASQGKPPAGKCEGLPVRVEKFINAFAAEVRGAEYCEFRKIVHGDINGDGIADLIICFTVEGACDNDKKTPAGAYGNHHEQYMKAFLGKELKEVPLRMVGERGERDIVGLAVNSGIIEAETLSYRENDPMCCPSLKGRTRFVLFKDVLVEQPF